MKNIINTNLHRKDRGFSLLEILLVVGISSLILLATVRLADTWADDLVDVQEAQYLVEVMDAAQVYVQNNFETIWSDPLLMAEGLPTALPDGSLTWTINNPDRVLRLGLSASSAGTPANFFLEDPVTGTLPVSFSNTTPLRFDAKIYIKNTISPTVQDKRSFEIFVMTDSLDGNILSVARANNIANKLGPEAGVISRIDPVTKTVFAGPFCDGGNVTQSIYGTWQIDGSDFIGNSINPDNEYCPSVIPGVDGRGAYIALRRVVVDDNDIINEVLYRFDIPGRPSANRMQANLNMNGNGINDVGVLSADKLNISGDLNAPGIGTRLVVEETARFAGVGSRILSTPTGAGAPDPNCTWDNIDAPTRTLNPAATGPCNMRGGNLTIGGEAGVAGRNSLTVDQLNAPGSNLSAQRMEATNTDVGSIAIFNNDVTITNAEVGGVSSNQMVVTGDLQTQTFQTGDLTVNSAPQIGGMITQVVQANGTNLNGLDVSLDSAGARGNFQVNGQINIFSGLNANEVTMNNMTNCRANVVHRFDLDGDGNYYEVPDDFETVPLYDCILGP